MKALIFPLAVFACVGLGQLAAFASPCTVLTDAEVFVDGAFVPGQAIRLEGHQITAVGADVPREGCAVSSFAGRVITPGLVETFTQVGLAEISAVKASVDTDLTTAFQDQGHTVRAAVESWRAFNPRSAVVGVTRVAGVTSVVGIPTGGVIRGGAFWADLTGGSQAVSLQKTPAAMVVSLGGGSASRAGSFHVLGVALDEAVLWKGQQKAWERNQRRAYLTPHLDLIALQPVIDGTLPLLVAVDRAADIEALLSMVGERQGLAKVRLIIAGGAEAWLVRAQLADKGIPVIVDPLLYHGANFDQLHARHDNAALLAASNVPIILSTLSSHNARKLRQVAGNAVRGGLDRAAALRAITQTPADALGLSKHGRIAPGAVANLVVWSGDPLEISTRIEAIYIHGASIPQVSRQTMLRDRYRTVPVRRLP